MHAQGLQNTKYIFVRRAWQGQISSELSVYLNSEDTPCKGASPACCGYQLLAETSSTVKPRCSGSIRTDRAATNHTAQGLPLLLTFVRKATTSEYCMYRCELLIWNIQLPLLHASHPTWLQAYLVASLQPWMVPAPPAPTCSSCQAGSCHARCLLSCLQPCHTWGSRQQDTPAPSRAVAAAPIPQGGKPILGPKKICTECFPLALAAAAAVLPPLKMKDARH